MSDVACVCCAPLVGEVRARGHEPDLLVAGLGLEIADLENVRNRIPWDAFRVFARRASGLLGGPEEIGEIASHSAEQAVPGFVRRLLPRLGNPRTLYVIGARWWGPWVFRGTRATCEVLPDGRLREVIEILPGYGDCPEFFEGIRGILRAMPRLFAQPEAVVDLDQDGRRGEFLIAPPPMKRRISRGLRLRPAQAEALKPDLPELEELGFRQEQLRDSLRQTRAATALLADKSRRLDALNRLGRELGQPHEIADVLKVLVGLLEDRIPMRGLRISEGPGFDDAGYTSLAESGEITGPPSASQELQVAGRSVGRVELWRSEDADSFGEESEAALQDLVPWISIAVENVRSNERAARIAHWIEEGLPQDPVLDRPADSDGHPDGPLALAQDAETILLVHDDPLVRGLSRRALEAEGHRVIEAQDGQDALSICQAGSLPIHLLVTGVETDALDRQLTRRFMKLRPELRGILLLRPEEL